VTARAAGPFLDPLEKTLSHRVRSPQQAAAHDVAGGPYVAAPEAYAAAPAIKPQPYTLDAGDKLRVVVFGQAGISNSYLVDAGGNVSMPLIGVVPARGLTTQQLSQRIAARLKQGYVREPHVSVEVEAYRPFFILGEVTNPGQYPYVANMTAETAVAIAGDLGPVMTSSETGLWSDGATKSTRFLRSSVAVRLPAAMSPVPSITPPSSLSRVVGRMTTVIGRLSSCFRYFLLM